MNRQHKLREGQVLLDDINNYRPLEEPMVETTAKNVQRMIKSLLQEGYIDDMTANGYPLRQTLLEYQYSTHSLRFTNRPLLVDLQYQGAMALQNVSQLLTITSSSL